MTIGQAMVVAIFGGGGEDDLDAGVVIEGSPRVLVEVAQDEVGCGDDFHPVFAHRIGEGACCSSWSPVSWGFGLEFWMTEGAMSFEVEPAVRSRRLRVACPDGTDAAAAELAAQRAIWEMRGPDSYEYSMTWYLFNNFYGDYRIGVVDGEAVSIVKDGVTRFNPAHVEGELPRTIDELLDELERQVSGDRLVAIYDLARFPGVRRGRRDAQRRR